MSELNLFHYAVKNKLRFNFRGQISAEDLYDLSLTNLNKIAVTLHEEKEKSGSVNFLGKESKADEELTNKLALVVAVIREKQAEATAKKEAQALREKRQRLLAIKANKEDEALNNLSIEEIDAQLAALDK